MKYQLFFIILLIVNQPISAAESNSTFYLIRHAEKDLNIKTDPPLTDEGHLRSQQWAEVFSQIDLDYVYSTDTERTRDTALPIAEQQDLKLMLYSPDDLNYNKFAQTHRGHSVLIVGHSNTSPAFANGLLRKEKYPELDESVYGMLYIVDINSMNRGGKVLMINPMPTKSVARQD